MTHTILITGATGWLGSNLLDALGGDVHIRCLVPGHERASPRSNVEVVGGDIRQAADVARFCDGARDAVLFHVAGVIHSPRVRDLYRINHKGTIDVVNAARRAGVRRIVGVSSNSPFGFNAGDSDVFDEHSPYHPYLNYGRSKWMMERALLDANGSGVETVVIRPPWYYGPHQPARQTLFYRLVRRGRVPVFGRGENRRSLAYVGNVVSAMRLAAASPAAAGQAYWIADARPYTMREIVSTIERVLQEFGHECRGRQVKVPFAAAAAARTVDRALQAAGFYNSKIHVLGEMSKTIACSIDKARRELGYEPDVDLEEGVRRSLRWCADHGIRM